MAKKHTASDTSAGAAPRSRATARRRTAATAAPATTAANDATMREPTREEIAEAAYRRYLSRGAEHGRDFDDWLEAERELKQQKAG